MRSNFEPGRQFANPTDVQRELDGWRDRVNRRVHRTIRAVPAERLVHERQRMRALPATSPDTDRRFVRRVPQQPDLRVDRNDYSIDPAFAGRRVEVRISQEHVTAEMLIQNADREDPDAQLTLDIHGLSFLGLRIDDDRNRTATDGCDLTGDGSKVNAVVISAREGREIAQQVRRVLA